jgi:hypothetical protein
MLLKVESFDAMRQTCHCVDEEGGIVRLGLLAEEIPEGDLVGKTLEVEGLFPYMYLARSVKLKEIQNAIA